MLKANCSNLTAYSFIRFATHTLLPQTVPARGLAEVAASGPENERSAVSNELRARIKAAQGSWLIFIHSIRHTPIFCRKRYRRVGLGKLCQRPQKSAPRLHAMLPVGASLKDRRIPGGTPAINRGRMKRTPGEGANFPRRYNPRPRFNPEPFTGPLLCRATPLQRRPFAG